MSNFHCKLDDASSSKVDTFHNSTLITSWYMTWILNIKTWHNVVTIFYIQKTLLCKRVFCISWCTCNSYIVVHFAITTRIVTPNINTIWGSRVGTCQKAHPIIISTNHIITQNGYNCMSIKIINRWRPHIWSNIPPKWLVLVGKLEISHG